MAEWAAAETVSVGPTPWQVLQSGLHRRSGPQARVVSIQEKPLGTFSTHPISRLQVTMAGGGQLRVIFKRLRPAPGKEVHREVACYERLLADRSTGAPELLASLSDDARGLYWLFLEDVGSRRLDWCGARDWTPAFQFLASMHARHLGQEAPLTALDCLAEHGPDFYRRLADDAQTSLRRHGEADALERFDALTDRWLGASTEFLTARPRTLVHGDLSCHNVMVQRPVTPERVRPIDWEWAAIGVPAWDVAKLLAGWGSRKPRFLSAYVSEFDRHATAPLDRAEFAREVAHCQALHKLWYLRWWIEPCREPGFVHKLLDRVERCWSEEP